MAGYGKAAEGGDRGQCAEQDRARRAGVHQCCGVRSATGADHQMNTAGDTKTEQQGQNDDVGEIEGQAEQDRRRAGIDRREEQRDHDQHRVAQAAQDD